eukprot:scaffold1621_cov350-Prasinococcus_capsulatus_cf.AAC.22
MEASALAPPSLTLLAYRSRVVSASPNDLFAGNGVSATASAAAPSGPTWLPKGHTMQPQQCEQARGQTSVEHCGLLASYIAKANALSLALARTEEAQRPQRTAQRSITDSTSDGFGAFGVHLVVREVE